MFGKNLRYYRKMRGYSQEELAKELGYKSFTTVQRWETSNSIPDPTMLDEIARILDVSISDLLSDAEPRKDEAKTLGDVIKDYRYRTGTSMQEFADRAGLSKGYISQLEIDINPRTGTSITPSYSTFKKVAAAMHMDINILLASVDEKQKISFMDPPNPRWDVGYPPKRNPRAINIPLLGRIAAGPVSEVCDDVYDWLEFTPDDSGNYFALKVVGESMEPVLKEGDIVFVREQSTVRSGDIAVVSVNSNEATCKVVQLSGDSLTLVGYNPAVYMPHTYTAEEVEKLPIVIKGKVVRMERRFD